MTDVAQARRTTLLNQILAVRQSVKGDTEKNLIRYHNLLKQQTLLTGFARTYKAHDDEDFTFPDEKSEVQVKAELVLKQITAELTGLFDITAAMDWTNQTAKADIVVFTNDGAFTIAEQVPVHYMLFLEKHLNYLEDLVRKLPILPATETWTFDPNTDMYRSNPVGTVKTKKTLRNHVKYEATNHHPAQVETYSEDTPIGTWTTVKFSGALPADRVNQMLNRVLALQQAVKYAREQANTAEVVAPKPGARILDYIFNNNS